MCSMCWYSNHCTHERCVFPSHTNFNGQNKYSLRFETVILQSGPLITCTNKCLNRFSVVYQCRAVFKS